MRGANEIDLTPIRVKVNACARGSPLCALCRGVTYNPDASVGCVGDERLDLLLRVRPRVGGRLPKREVRENLGGVCVRACARVRVRACVRACVCACVRAHVWVWVWVWVWVCLTMPNAGRGLELRWVVPHVAHVGQFVSTS